MKAVLISIQPKWCELIANGKKTIEVRKTRPKLKTPFKCYIYCTKSMTHLYAFSDDIDCSDIGKYYTTDHNKYSLVPNGYLNGKVIGEFVCDSVDKYKYDIDGVDIDEDTLLETMLDWEEINIYAHGKTLYGWHISDLIIYDKPKELWEFSNPFEIKTRKTADGIVYKAYHKTIIRPPQSWCYAEEQS